MFERGTLFALEFCPCAQVNRSGAACFSPYGMEDGETFVLYLPDTPTDGLDEDFLSWWPGCYAPEGAPETLETYGLLNAKMGYGFFSDPM